MINVSFNDLAAANEPSAPRTPSRAKENSAFAAMMDEADSRQTVTASREGRGRASDRHEASGAERPAAASTTRQDQPDSSHAADPDTASKPRSSATPNKNSATREAADDTAEPAQTQTGDDVAKPETDQQTAAATTTDDTTETTPVPTSDATTQVAQGAILAAVTPVTPLTTPTVSVQPTTAGIVAPAPLSAMPTPTSTPTPASAQADGKPLPPVQPGIAAPPSVTPAVAPVGPTAASATPVSAPVTPTAAPVPPLAGSIMPTPPPDATKAAGAARPAAAALQAVGGQVPIVTVSVGAVPTVAARTGKVVPETLFVATVLSQPATAVATSASAPAASGPPQAAPAVQPQPNSPSAVLQTAPLAASAVAIPTTVSATKPLENSQTADAAPRDPRTAPAPMAPQPSAQPGTATPSAQPAVNLAPAGLAPAGAATAPTTNTLQIDVSQAESPTPIKPAPALANGMATQFGTNAPSDGHAKPGTQTATSATAASTAGTPTANAVAPQTATAVAPPPPVQPPSDDPKAKLATPDSPVVNAAVPAGGPHTTQAPTVDATGNAKAPVPTPPVFDQVAVHVAKAAADGLDKINIKLKPATLGHIEVHLEVASNGHVHAVIAADKPETLDLLQRDARALERALGDAGLRTDSGSLSFNLRGQGQQYGGYNGNHPLPRFSPAVSRPGSDIALPSDIGRMNAYLSSRAAAGGVDIRV